MEIEIRVTAFEDQFGDGELNSTAKQNYEICIEEVAQEYFPDAQVRVDLDWESTNMQPQMEHWGVFDITDEDNEEIIEVGDHFWQQVWRKWSDIES